jgi:hypothetical protein
MTNQLLQVHFVHVAPLPALSGFKRPHDGMIGFLKVFCPVLVDRGVAASDVATAETKAQMHPAGTHFLAFLASFGIASDLLIYSINVHTSCLFLFRHGFNNASCKLKIIVSRIASANPEK